MASFKRGKYFWVGCKIVNTISAYWVWQGLVRYQSSPFGEDLLVNVDQGASLRLLCLFGLPSIVAQYCCQYCCPVLLPSIVCCPGFRACWQILKREEGANHCCVSENTPAGRSRRRRVLERRVIRGARGEEGTYQWKLNLKHLNLQEPLPKDKACRSMRVDLNWRLVGWSWAVFAALFWFTAPILVLMNWE